MFRKMSLFILLMTIMLTVKFKYINKKKVGRSKKSLPENKRLEVEKQISTIVVN